MKNWIRICYGALAPLAITVTSLVANSTCIYLMHQDELPETAKKLRRF